MKSSTLSGKNGIFSIVVFTCALRVLQEMFSYSRKRSFSFKASDWLARAGQCAAVLRSMPLPSGFSYMLLNPPLQPLESMTHVPTIIVAQKLINHVALM